MTTRRAFLGTAAMTLAAAELGVLGLPAATEGGSRQLTAFDRATPWINSPPLSAASLLGKAVLVQFGTYTCINWLRTLPYVRAWHQRYMPGLAVIGVHTPEFAFEKDLDNVRRAMQHMNIGFPIALDNDSAIWRAFDNHYWPALYLLDARRTRPLPPLRRGRVRAIREGHSATAHGHGRDGRRRRRPRRRLGDGDGIRAARRLAESEISRDVPRA